MYEIENESLSTYVKNHQLSAICFIMDYLEIQFDGAQLQIYTNPFITDHVGKIGWTDDGFRDRICGLITKIVVDTEITKTYLKITFENKAEIFVPLYGASGPESALFRSPVKDGEWWVLHSSS